MAVAGRKSNITFQQYEEAIRENHGRISFAAKKLDIAANTLHVKIGDDLDLQKIVEDARKQAHDLVIDQAEAVMSKTMQMIEYNPKISLKAAVYVLDKKGRNRGWGDTKRDDSETHALLSDLNENLLKEREQHEEE